MRQQALQVLIQVQQDCDTLNNLQNTSCADLAMLAHGGENCRILDLPRLSLSDVTSSADNSWSMPLDLLPVQRESGVNARHQIKIKTEE